MEYYNDELMHYGVKGMKWGVRRARPQTAVDSARANYKTAKKEYNKSFNKAYNRAVAAYSPVKKHQQANEKRWEDAANKAEKLKEAKTEYKKAKTERKAQIKSTYKDIKKSASLGEKIIYNSATRKKAAQYVVDNGMSLKEANAKAKTVAKRNTAAFLAAYGALTVGSLYMNSRR